MSVQSMPAALPGERPFGPIREGGAARLCRWLAVCILLAAGLGLAACKPTAAKPMTVGITGYNFTAEGVQEYYVNGMRGSNLPPYGGGGSTSCCVSLPAKWAPGLTVKVSWTIGDWKVPYTQIATLSTQEQIACCWTERTLSKVIPVKPYGEKGGRLQVFFLPKDEMQIWVSEMGLLSPEHPSRMGYPKKPNITE